MFYFQPADIVTQILNFGLPAQIDVRTVGYDRANEPARCQGAAAAHRGHPRRSPTRISSRRSMRPAFYADDRSRAGRPARPQREQHRHQYQCQPELVRAGHAQFLDRSDNGIPYYLAVQTPEHQVSSLNDLGNTPVSSTVAAAAAIRCRACSAMSRRFKRDSVPTNANQANIQPVYEVYASAQGRDLGSVSDRHRARSSPTCRSSSRPATHPGRRPDPEHERRLPRSRHRPAVRRRVRLPADGRELSEFRRPVRGHPGAAGDASAASSRCCSSPARRSTCPR